jgi:Ca2+/Na+ antiporter
VKKKDSMGKEVWVEEPVWNWVVANISLMALGSSIPEIMLSLIEAILTLGKPAGELGAATIVGSAAFNLFVIVGVCTAAMKDGKACSHAPSVLCLSTPPVFSFCGRPYQEIRRPFLFKGHLIGTCAYVGVTKKETV